VLQESLDPSEWLTLDEALLYAKVELGVIYKGDQLLKLVHKEFQKEGRIQVQGVDTCTESLSQQKEYRTIKKWAKRFKIPFHPLRVLIQGGKIPVDKLSKEVVHVTAEEVREWIYSRRRESKNRKGSGKKALCKRVGRKRIEFSRYMVRDRDHPDRPSGGSGKGSRV
jgi:hypothetical protein